MLPIGFIGENNNNKLVSQDSFFLKKKKKILGDIKKMTEQTAPFPSH